MTWFKWKIADVRCGTHNLLARDNFIRLSILFRPLITNFLVHVIPFCVHGCSHCYISQRFHYQQMRRLSSSSFVKVGLMFRVATELIWCCMWHWLLNVDSPSNVNLEDATGMICDEMTSIWQYPLISIYKKYNVVIHTSSTSLYNVRIAELPACHTVRTETLFPSDAQEDIFLVLPFSVPQVLSAILQILWQFCTVASFLTNTLQK